MGKSVFSAVFNGWALCRIVVMASALAMRCMLQAGFRAHHVERSNGLSRASLHARRNWGAI